MSMSRAWMVAGVVILVTIVGWWNTVPHPYKVEPGIKYSLESFHTINLTHYDDQPDKDGVLHSTTDEGLHVIFHDSDGVRVEAQLPRGIVDIQDVTTEEAKSGSTIEWLPSTQATSEYSVVIVAKNYESQSHGAAQEVDWGGSPFTIPRL